MSLKLPKAGSAAHPFWRRGSAVCLWATTASASRSVTSPGGDALKPLVQGRVGKKSGEGDADLRRQAGRCAAFGGARKGHIERDRLPGPKANSSFVDEPLVDVARECLRA